MENQLFFENPNTADNTASSFHLSLFSDADEMYTLWLPMVPEGFFRFSDSPKHHFLGIAAIDGQWTAVSRKPAFFLDVPLNQSYSCQLCDGKLLKLECEDRTYFLLSKRISQEQMIFRNYTVTADTDIRIGSLPGSDICSQSPYVSGLHAVISRIDGRWRIRDCGSTYGTFVNGLKITSCTLQTGDVIYIMGLRIMAGPNFLSITDNLDGITINKHKLQDVSSLHSGFSRYSGQTAPATEVCYFNRLPRKRLEIEQNTITVEGPPMSANQTQMPLMLRMGSSMIMGGTAALAGNFTTLMSSVLFPLLSSKYTDKQRQEYEQLRLTKYREYLRNKRNEINQACLNESRLLNQKYPPIQNVLSIVQESEHLWERRPTDNDFLQIRLGTGTLPLTTAIEYPPRRFALDTDALEEEMYTMVESPHLVDNVPVVLSLGDTRVCSLLGPRDLLFDHIRHLIMQIAAFHSYDEVKTVFFLSTGELSLLNEIRYLPHTWDDQRTVRFVATNEADAYKLGEYIKNQIPPNDTENKSLNQVLSKRPYYIIFALDKKIFESHETFKEILQSENTPGFSIVTAYNELPKESQQIITLRSDQWNICTTMGSNGGEDTLFRTDLYSKATFSKAMRILANTHLKTTVQGQEIPKLITFLEMFRSGRIEQLNVLKRWKENNPVKSLAAPVGIGADGSLFTLDLHEKRQGPHGLVAGMTGSGKSEFIITYILSMAVNYHPDEVAFVLIDYKGGGLTGAFENPQTGVKLPHLVGTITNLDGASIQRSLMSIESELLRRQRIFNEVKSTVNAGTMDIYSYQKLYRAGKVAEPMPHLFIISDEFAELKQQQPEFMAQLISAARIGRSLGVHLILATQKPTGVVDDQIRSNTKFRVCLRVQERSDSMDMLKRPEAAELTDTGRFYLQVGYNEYFALGQSAWCGAAYEPQDTPTVRRDDAIEFLDTTGQVIAKAAPKVKKSDSGKKQIVAVVEYLSELAEALNIHPRQLWQPELPKLLDLDELQRQHPPVDPMSVCLGQIDDPENQTQFPLTIEFASCQNLLITGDTGSGKSAIVQNILYTLARQLSPKDFQFYLLDYSSRMMKLFKPLPHCGAVLFEEESDSLDNFFKLITGLVTQRKKLFAELEVDNFEEARLLAELPLVFVVIDNVAGLSSTKTGESYSFKLQSYLKNSANYGIKYILTCSHLNEVTSRIRQEMGQRICLHMKDKYDYSEMLECKVSYQPPDVTGRGLCKVDGRPLEFHSAILCADADDAQRTAKIKQTVDELCQRYRDLSEAQHLPIYSETATYEEFTRQFKRGRIPLGYAKQTGKPVALPLKQFSALSVYLGNPLGQRPIIENLLWAAGREQMDVWIVKRIEHSIFGTSSDSEPIALPSGARVFSCNQSSINQLREQLTAEVTARNNLLQEECARMNIAGTPEEQYKQTFTYLRANTVPIMLMVENFADFCVGADFLSTLIFDKAFQVAQRRNIYVVACFEPGDHKRVARKTLYHGFNADANALLLGGQFDQQTFCPIPESSGLGRLLPFNAGLMHYKNQFHPVLMPCGDLSTGGIDEDELSIF